MVDELAQPILLHGLRGERAVFTELIRRVGTGEIPISDLSFVSKNAGSSMPSPSSGPWVSLWFDNQLAVGLAWMNEHVAIARRPSAERTPGLKAWQARMERVKNDRIEMFTAVLPLLMMAGREYAFFADSRVESELGATIILLAAERHRRKSGDWPSSVAGIDRALLPDPPVDPFSGQAFKMERRDGRLLVYSIGPDLKDEHGAYDPKRWMKGGPDDVGTSGWDKDRRRQASHPRGSGEDQDSCAGNGESRYFWYSSRSCRVIDSCRNWSANRLRPSCPIASRAGRSAASRTMASMSPSRSRGLSRTPVFGFTTSRAPSMS